MGGPYITLEKIQRLLQRLQEEQFYGEVTLEWEDGNIRRIQKIESLKLPALEKKLGIERTPATTS